MASALLVFITNMLWGTYEVYWGRLLAFLTALSSGSWLKRNLMGAWPAAQPGGRVVTSVDAQPIKFP